MAVIASNDWNWLSASARYPHVGSYQPRERRQQAAAQAARNGRQQID